MLVNRDTGEPVSAIDARWWPEFGNRGELEAKIGAIVSSLVAAVAAMSTLPVFHPHIPSARVRSQEPPPDAAPAALANGTAGFGDRPEKCADC